MQEEYGIKLKILTENLQQSVNKAKGIVSQFTSKIKADFEEARQPLELNISGQKFDSQIQYIEDKIANLKHKLNLADLGYEVGDVSGIPAKIEMLTNKLNVLKNKEKEVGDEAVNTKSKLSGISVSANMTNNTIVNGFERSWKTIKRFAFSLLSIRGIYGLVRKASSAYMAQDTQMANQMQKTWASLGAMMAPIIEKIVHWIRVAAAYINYFVKALTGKDLIGKAVKKINAYNKAVGGTAKSAKALNKELTTLDEVTNLSFDDTSGFEDAAQSFDDFSDIKLDPKITDTLDKWAAAAKRLWENLKPVRDIVGKIVDWAIDNPDAVLTILGGAALLTFIGKLTTSGLAGYLTNLATIGIVVVGVDLIYSAVTGRHLIDDLKEIKKGMEEVADMRKANTKQSKQQVDSAKEVATYYKTLSQDYEKNEDKIADINDKLIHNNDLKLKEIDAIKHEINIRPKWNKNQKEYAKQIQNIAKAEKTQTNAMYNNWKQGKTNAEQTKQLADAIRNQIEKYQELEKNTKKNGDAQKVYKERIKELQTQLLNMTGKDYNARVNLDTTNAEKKSKKTKDDLDALNKKKATPKIDINNKDALNKANAVGDKLKGIDKKYKPTMDLKVGTTDAKGKVGNFLRKTKDAMVLGGVMNKFNAAILESLIKAIPGYDVGTNYIPNDQLAMVHKGEAIVPKKFNDKEFFNQSNDETNALLVELNRNIIDLRNRPNVFEVNGKELAQATYSDYQNEGNRLNQSMTIKRS